MSALTNRQQARERAAKAFFAALDRIIPPEESVPLKGSTFLDWENQVEELRQAVLPTVLEERAGLEDNAKAEQGGHCPHCGSDRVYLEAELKSMEVISPHGPLNLPRQQGRCRNCGASFSPSGT